MSTVLEYILKLQDGISGTVSRITSASAQATTGMNRLERQTRENEQAFNRAGNAASGFRGKLSSALSQIPGMDLITNPILLAGTAMAATTTMGLKFEENMSKINTTAQLSKSALGDLSDDILSAGLKYGASDMGALPEAYEKIISQTGDVAQSMDILGMSVKGSKAGFTEQAVVADALAQTLSLVGKENANAQEVLDTFFAAKRVGAGEFKDFAHYMPNLIASGKALGIAYKDVAGQFAYMTGKGFSAEKSATLLENAYTALGNKDITDGLKNAGINVFDEKGSIQSFDKIFAGLQSKMGSMSDQKKSAWLGSIKIKDAQAKSAFMALASDSEKLTEALKSTNNAVGETDTAFKNAQNPMMKIQALWGKIQFAAIQFGRVVSIVVNPVLDGVNWLFNQIGESVNFLVSSLREGDIGMWAWVTVMGALVIGYSSLAIWQGIVTVATMAWEGAQWLLNAALTANPIGLIIAAIVALIALIGFVIYKTDGWGKMWAVVVNNAKISWEYFTSSVNMMWVSTVNGIMNGINRIKIGWYSFKNAIGIGDEGENNALIAAAENDEKKREAETKAAVDRQNKASANLKNTKNALSELSWNNKSLGDIVGGVKKKVSGVVGGIAPAKIPGGLDNDMSAFGGDDKKEKKKAKGLKTDKTNEAIATGGTKHNYITINFKDLIGIQNYSGARSNESEIAGQNASDELLRVLAMATTAGV